MPLEYPTSVRLPARVRSDFKRLSRQNRRSLSREIVMVLSQYLVEHPVLVRRKEASAVDSIQIDQLGSAAYPEGDET